MVTLMVGQDGSRWMVPLLPGVMRIWCGGRLVWSTDKSERKPHDGK